jgi:hypothetical protein
MTLAMSTQAYILVAERGDQDTLFTKEEREPHRIPNRSTNPPYQIQKK